MNKCQVCGVEMESETRQVCGKIECINPPPREFKVSPTRKLVKESFDVVKAILKKDWESLPQEVLEAMIAAADVFKATQQK